MAVGGAAGGAGIGGGTGASAGVGGAGGSAGGAAGGGSGGVAGGAGNGAGGTAGCATACKSTETCVGTKCLLNDGQTCSLASQCATAACTAFYVDADGDGYGAGTPAGFCGTTTPVGYASQNGDCCDDSAHAVAKLIHPGADFQTASAGGVCNVTWDYDCDGTVETSKSLGSCKHPGSTTDCTNVPGSFPESDCGTTQTPLACTYYISTCTAYPSDSATVIGCR
jgi:hypothetical protein